MAIWPLTLPQYVDQDGYAQTTKNPLIRTDMEAGPAKVRLRYTAVPEEFNISLVMTKAQFEAFITFFKQTIHYGADIFTWRHPVTRGLSNCRFTSMYNASPHGLDFKVTISMEILPA